MLYNNLILIQFIKIFSNKRNESKDTWRYEKMYNNNKII